MNEEDDFFEDVFSGEEEAEKPDANPEPVEAKSEEPAKEPETAPQTQEAEAKQETPPPEDATQEASEAESEPSPEPERIDQNQFKGYLDEREKRQTLEREKEALQAQVDAFKRQQEQAKQPDPVPDMFDDPDGYRDWQVKQAQDIALQSKLNTSEMLAVQEFGEDKVREAQLAFQSLPQHEQIAIQQSRHPYRDLILRREDERVVQQIREAGGLDKYVEAQLAAKSAEAAQLSGAIDAAAKGVKPTPPPSLAKGGQGQKAQVPVSDEDVFNSLFN